MSIESLVVECDARFAWLFPALWRSPTRRRVPVLIFRVSASLHLEGENTAHGSLTRLGLTLESPE